MRLDTVMIADHAVAAEGKLYISGGGITRINVPFVPFAVPVLSIILRYKIETPGDRGRHELEMQLETPSGARLLPEGPMGIDPIPKPPNLAPGEEQYVQAVFSLGGVPIIEVGLHTLTVAWDGEQLREFKIPVVLIQGDGAQPPPNRADRRRKPKKAAGQHRRRGR